MDRSALTRKRQRDAPQPVRPSTSGSITDSRARSPHKPSSARSRSQPAAEALDFRPHSSGKIRKARDSSEITRAKRGDGGVSQQEEMTAAEDDRQSQHFTVGGVGAGGTLYLTPSRLPPPQYTLPPIIPGRVAGRDSVKTVWPSARTSNVSAGSGARPRGRGSAYDHTVPVPPVSIANVGAKRRPRSHSFSTLSEHEKSRAPTLNSTDVQDFRFFLNGKRRSQSQRPKSYMNLGEGLLQHHIPHYRLGTPRFSARGTAQLSVHNDHFCRRRQLLDVHAIGIRQALPCATWTPHERRRYYIPIRYESDDTHPYTTQKSHVSAGPIWGKDIRLREDTSEPQ